VFWLGGVLDGRTRREAGAALHVLDRKGFVARARASSVADETEYAFLHILVRDVAYAQIPRADRAAKHRRAAEWIESLGRPEDHAETLAHHYLAALELARASGQLTEALADRARVALREAGDRAAALNAFDSAARSYESALELWPSADPHRPRLLLAYGWALAIAHESGDAELKEAAQGLVELGDHEHAAQAEIALADERWRAAQRDAAYEHLERAVSLVEDVPTSAAKALVLSEVSRYHMLGDRRSDAIEVGRQAFEMATVLGLDEVRSHALDNIGAARTSLGDSGGLRDLEQSIEIANRIGSFESLRGYNNLFASYVTLGKLDPAAEALRAGLEVANRFGVDAGSARWLRFERLHPAYWQGRWDDAQALIEESLQEVGPTHALSRWNFEIRGRIRLARDDVAGALDDAEKSLELGRPAKDPQTFYAALSFAAVAALEAGRTLAAAGLADELLALDPANHHIAHHSAPLFDLAWVLIALDRRGELVEAIARATTRTAWTDAAEALARADYPRAASAPARSVHSSPCGGAACRGGTTRGGRCTSREGARLPPRCRRHPSYPRRRSTAHRFRVARPLVGRRRAPV
jgi:tetratricopeptide (TPR) repeat protein